jgi:GT2 family glycosyltransferase
MSVPVPVSIVLYHGDHEWAVRAIASFAAQERPCGPILVHCNDDDGTDAADLRARLELAGLDTVVELSWGPDNLGYAGGHNRALQQQFAAGADAVLVANADLVLRPDAVAAMHALSHRLGGRVLVGPFLSLADAQGVDEGLIDTTGIVWSRTGRHFDAQQGEPDALAPTDARPVAGVSGACLYVPRPAYEAILAGSGEFFDELFVAYREDAELGFRAALLGVGSWVEPMARGSHARGSRGTTRSRSAAVNRLGVQNRFLIAFKYGRRRPGGRVLPWFRDAVVIGGVLLRERESLPGLRRAVALRREASDKGRRVLSAATRPP